MAPQAGANKNLIKQLNQLLNAIQVIKKGT